MGMILYNLGKVDRITKDVTFRNHQAMGINPERYFRRLI